MIVARAALGVVVVAGADFLLVVMVGLKLVVVGGMVLLVVMAADVVAATQVEVITGLMVVDLGAAAARPKMPAKIDL